MKPETIAKILAKHSSTRYDVGPDEWVSATCRCGVVTRSDGENYHEPTYTEAADFLHATHQVEVLKNFPPSHVSPAVAVEAATKAYIDLWSVEVITSPQEYAEAMLEAAAPFMLAKEWQSAYELGHSDCRLGAFSDRVNPHRAYK